jgi:hypothetical protein
MLAMNGSDARLFRPSRLFAWPLKAGEMKHYEELFDLYDLGRIHRLRSIDGTDTKSARLYDLFICGAVLEKFVTAQGNRELLPGSVGVGRKLLERSRRLMNEGFDSEKGKETIGNSESMGFTNDLTAFDALLNHELGKLPAYIIEKKIGIYNLDDLANNANQHLSVVVDKQVADDLDLKAAGRCLAFELCTASGFHSVRAVEGAARKYYKLLTNKDPEEAGMPLGPIVNGLREKLKSEGSDNDTPLGMIISTLARINNVYRKPLTHPEMVLDTSDAAKLLFELAGVAISQIAEDHRNRESGTKLLTAAS